MHKKLSILLTVALFAGLMAFVAAPAANANTNDSVTSLLPDEDGAGTADGQILSDRPDGTDSLAHLTVDTTAQTDRVEWWACPPGIGTAGTDPVTQAQLASCTVKIGEDTTGKLIGQGTILTGANNEAYDINWDIPQNMDGQTFDILVLACVGAGTDIEGSDRNCRQDLEEDVFVDDAQSGGAATDQTTSAEMFAICTADTDNPTTGTEEGPDDGANDLCQIGGAGAGTDAQVNARFKPWTHGDPVPNEGYVIRASSSADVSDLWMLRDYDVDFDTDADTEDDTEDCDLIESTTLRKVWQCVAGWDAGTDNDTTQAVWVTNREAADSGYCAATECILDSHITASSARGPAAIEATFEANPPSPPAGTSCTTPDKDETNQLEVDEDITVCVTDQFGDPLIGTEVTLESSGVGGFLDCPNAGTLHDHDGDGLNEHCHTTTGANGQVNDITIRNLTTVGDQTITACQDDESDAAGAAPSGNPAGTGHGCADESLKTTLVKHWRSLPEDVFLVFAGTGDAADPCRTGDTQKENVVGDQDQLLVCTFDGTTAHNPATTDQPNGGRLQWTITPSGGGEVTATRFVGSPPSETGSDATATATIESFRPGNDVIRVNLQDESGDIIDFFTVQKRVVQGAAQCSDNVDNDGDGKVDANDPGCSGPNDNDETDTTTGGGKVKHGSGITIRYDADANRFKGQVTSDKKKCQKFRKVKLFKKRKGPDAKVGSDKTNKAGNWKIFKKNAKGRFYAKVLKKKFTSNNGTLHVCLPDKSPTIKI